MGDIFDRLCRLAGEKQVKKDEPMKRHTTFRAGGPAKFFVSPLDEEALKHVICFCREENIPYYLLGNGSNLLVSDAGYDGVMLSLGNSCSEIEILEHAGSDTAILKAGAGSMLAQIAKEALKKSLTGFEFAAGIPGTLGGAIVMNAGAYGGEMKDVLLSVRVLTKEGTIKELSKEELHLSYRHSCIPKEEYLVLSAELCLQKGNAEEILKRMEELLLKRREKQPLEYPSAGSTFKRPEGYFAGKLIEEAGLRGYRIGDAEVSEKHCGFVINRGEATAEEIRTLCFEVQRKVKETSGVKLELEVKMIGW